MSSVDPTAAPAEQKKVQSVESDNLLETTTAPPDDSERTSSSLSSDKSEKKGLEQQREMAGVPVLPPPLLQPNEYDFGLNNLLRILDPSQKGMNTNEALAMVNATMMNATSNMLTGWIENLREIQEYKNAAHQLEVKKEQMLESIKMNQNLQDKNSKDTTDAVNKFASYALLVSAGLLSLGVGHVVIPASIFTFATKAAGIVSTLSASAVIDGALSSLVGLFGISFVTQAAVATLKSAPKDSDEYNYEFAKNYAVRTLQVTGPGNEVDKAVIAVTTSDTGVTSTKTVLVKIALLSQSLAFAYHLETGAITGQEFEGLLDGTTKLPKDDFRNTLIAAISAQLNLITDPEQRAQVRAKLKEYFDSKPDLSELSEPAAALRSMFGNKIHLPISA